MAKALPHEPSLYERDFFAWTQDQAARLRARAAFDNRGDIDWRHAAEEIEDLGSLQRNKIESRLAVLLMHLLKWRFQPSGRCNSWRATITEQRLRLARRLRQNPNLRPYPSEILAEEYALAKLHAVAETGLGPDVFPDSCPFAIDDILNPDFLPETE